MIIPIRCFTCGKITGNKWNRYISLTRGGVTEEDALDQLGLTRYCCRRMIVSHVDRIDQHLAYNESKVVVPHIHLSGSSKTNIVKAR